MAGGGSLGLAPGEGRGEGGGWRGWGKEGGFGRGSNNVRDGRSLNAREGTMVARPKKTRPAFLLRTSSKTQCMGGPLVVLDEVCPAHNPCAEYSRICFQRIRGCFAERMQEPG